jgi:hypothetical protein
LFPVPKPSGVHGKVLCRVKEKRVKKKLGWERISIGKFKTYPIVPAEADLEMGLV